MSVIKNRLQKNYLRLKPWAEKLKLEAYRIYERDIPEYPFIVDRYKDCILIYDRRDKDLDFNEKKSGHFEELLEAVQTLFNPSTDQLIVKKRERQSGLNQYEKLADKNHFINIREGPAVFRVNLWDYLDTGLFLDHRILREMVKKESAGKKVLNLFSYTCSISVFAALGEGFVTSVDMSQNYLDWGKQNFQLNSLPLDKHRFLCENAMDYLETSSEKFDLIICDPPTFSNSKKMSDYFEIEKDQVFLVKNCMRMLAPQGTFYFSNNKRDFKLDPSLFETYSVKDLSKQSIPKDFNDQKIHKVFQIRTKTINT